jgi:hypothetical protein
MDKLKVKTIESMWIEDLDKFVDVLDEIETKEARDNEIEL